MRITGTESSSVILVKQSGLKKFKSDAKKMPTQAKAKTGDVINPVNYIFNQF